MIEDRQVTNVEDLGQLSPGVTIGTTLGQARISIRGISFDQITQGSETRAAYHIDGVYVSRPPAQLATFFDVDRVEVLRGPQGTLYGRNATAGAVNVVSHDPEFELGGYLRGTFGDRSLLRTEGAVNIPLSDKVATRIAFQTTNRDGYGTNLATGEENEDLNTRSVRAKVLAELSPDLTIKLSGDYFRQSDHSGGYIYLAPGFESAAVQPNGIAFGSGNFATEPHDTAAEIASNEREIYGFASDIEWNLGDVSLYSLTGYRNSLTELKTDLDGVPELITDASVLEDSEQFSQEFRLQGDFGRLFWILGAYYFDETVEGGNSVPFTNAIVGNPNPQFVQGFFQGGSVSTEAWAVFGQADFDLTDRLSLTLGGRFSSEEKSVDEIFQLDFVRPFDPNNPLIPFLGREQVTSESWDGFTPKVSLDYEFSDNVFGYLTYSEGFKSGGFNVGAVGPAFDREKVKSYEGGIRSDLFNNTVRANVSGFFYEYDDIQVTRLLNNIIAVENAASAEIYGLEAEVIAAVTDSLTIDLNASLLETEFTDFISGDSAQPSLGEFDLSGNQLPQAPNYTVNAGVEYVWPLAEGDLTFRADGHWTDKVFFSAFNRDIVSEDAHSRFDLLLKYDSSSNWSASAYVRNLTDEENLAYSVVGAGLFGFPVLGTYKPPRTYGASLKFEF